jgi:N-acetylglucosamine kinase-like BadF-type ATPase
MKHCVIGVDGGGTKTDYFLFDLEGSFIDYIQDGTCSREIVGDEEAERLLNARIKELLARNGFGIEQVQAGAFGLAGIDDHTHQAQFAGVFKRMGLKRFEADNDSYLGVMAGTSKGFGVCSINGTGTVAGGIDPQGKRLQVGGIGPLTGDDAGGSSVAHSGIRAVYDSFYRCGEKTLMAEPVFKLLEIKEPSEMMYAIGKHYDKLGGTEFTRIVFAAANQGDQPALKALRASAKQLAKSSAGCVRGLGFGNEVEIVLAGSVWVKGESPALFEAYKYYMARFLPERSLSFHKLQEPPATGAILWALSLCGTDCFGSEMRSKVVDAVKKYFT